MLDFDIFLGKIYIIQQIWRCQLKKGAISSKVTTSIFPKTVKSAYEVLKNLKHIRYIPARSKQPRIGNLPRVHPLPDFLHPPNIGKDRHKNRHYEIYPVHPPAI